MGEFTPSGSRKGNHRGTTRFTGETGKYKGMRGLLITNVRYDTDQKQGNNIAESKGEYWVEQ